MSDNLDTINDHCKKPKSTSGNENKTVLVTGGCGFIGSYFTRYFLDSGYKVHVIDDLSTGSLSNLPKHSRLTFQRSSVLDKQALRGLSFVDFVVHLSSVVGMKLAKSNHTLAYDTSTVGTRNVLESTGNAPSLVFSSSAVYGVGDTSAEMSESHPIDIQDLFDYDGGKYGYALGKWELEKIALGYSSAGRKMLIIRPFNIVGLGQVSSYGMVVPRFVDQALANQPITVYGDGQQARCFSEVSTFIKAVVRLLDFEDVWSQGRNIINIGSGDSVAINEIAKIVIERSASKSEVIHIPFNEIYPGQIDVKNRIPNTAISDGLLGEIYWPTMKTIIDACLVNAQDKKEEVAYG